VALANPYQTDLTGALGANLISNEKQTVSGNNPIANRLVRPSCAPFYAHGLVLRYYSSGQTLSTATLGVDYFPVYELQDLSQVTAYPVYGAIKIVNPSVLGTIFLTYQTLGGNFAGDKQALSTQLVYAQQANPAVPWSRIIGTPTYYPVNDHPLNVQTETVGYTSIVNAINAIASTITTLNITTDMAAMIAHMSNTSNPHNLTKAQIGLGNVQNYPLATNPQATAGVSTTTYLTPATAYLASIAQMPTATSTVLGKSTLNDGSTSALGTNNVAILTAAGLRQLATAQGAVSTSSSTGFILGNSSSSSNAVVSAIAPAMLIGQITPTPLAFPLWWKGKQFTTLLALVADISSSVGTGLLPYSPSGMVWFPTGITVPSLVTSASAPGSYTTGRSVRSAVNQQLKYNP
jgi:hypothetical protein